MTGILPEGPDELGLGAGLGWIIGSKGAQPDKLSVMTANPAAPRSCMTSPCVSDGSR